MRGISGQANAEGGGRLRSSGKFYGVLIESESGSPFLAYCGSGEAPMLFTKWGKANTYRKELAEHIKSRGKVVPVLAEFSVLTRV